MKHAQYLAAFAVIIFSACAGTAARSDALWPVIDAKWPVVRDQARAAADEPAEVQVVDAADAAIRAGTPIAVVAVNWTAVRSLAVEHLAARAAAGEIGPGVLDSLMERVTQFDAAIASYTAKVPQ